MANDQQISGSIDNGEEQNAEARIYDVAIIGAGPAGLTSGIYAARAGLDAVIVESISFGGQMAQTEHLENYPGFNKSKSGFDLAEVMNEQAEGFGAQTVYGEVVSVDFSNELKTLRLPDGEIEAKSVIIASGARPARLGLANEEKLIGSGVSYCATCDGNFFRDKVVCVVGGGDTAVADAIYLSRICSKVYMIVRRDVLRATAIYHSKLNYIDNVEILWNTIVTDIHDEEGSVSSLRLHNKISNEDTILECSALFVAIGTVPNIEFLNNAVDLDYAGYIVADESCKTSIDGVFAAGDVRSKRLRQITTAVADGANAVESADEYLLSLNK